MPDETQEQVAQNEVRFVSASGGGRLFRPNRPSLAVNITHGGRLNVRLSMNFAKEAGLKKGDRGVIAYDLEKQQAAIGINHPHWKGLQLKFLAYHVFYSGRLESELAALWKGWQGRALHYYQPIVEEEEGVRFITFSYADIVPNDQMLPDSDPASQTVVSVSPSENPEAKAGPELADPQPRPMPN
jgi:hypothetical protein